MNKDQHITSITIDTSPQGLGGYKIVSSIPQDWLVNVMCTILKLTNQNTLFTLSVSNLPIIGLLGSIIRQSKTRRAARKECLRI